MKLILFLLRASWRVVLLAAVIGGISGAASVALVAMIMKTLNEMANGHAAAAGELVGYFVAICVVILLTASRLPSAPFPAHANVDRPTAIGALPADSRIAADASGEDRHAADAGFAHRRRERGLAGDERRARARREHRDSRVRSGSIWAGSLPSLLVGAVVFCVLGMASYWYSSRFAQRYIDRAREELNTSCRSASRN